MNTKRNELTVNYQGKPCYNIVCTNEFDALSNRIAGLGFGDRRICIVTDSGAGPLYLTEVKERLQEITDSISTFVLPSGEEHKTLDSIRSLYAFLIDHHFDRHDLLVALGGGVIGDMTGFCAATYLRGIGFVQVPTTLLAQTDSSVGGKTGVDFSGYKNMVGAFYMPRLVYIQQNVLETLSDRQLLAGLAEVVKYGLIRDKEFYQFIVEHLRKASLRDLMEEEPQTIRTLILESCRNKKEVVERDPTEKGERALLNFGHTIGHAIEKAMHFSLLHGECVSIGSIAACFISYKRNLISRDVYASIRQDYQVMGLPISTSGFQNEEVLHILKSDKKMDRGQIRFLLLKKIGEAYIDESVTDEEILAALKEVSA